MDEIKRVPTVGIVVIDGDRVLLVKHGENAGHITGSIGTPGGRIEANETALHAAVRELEEETGIHVEEVDLQQIPHEYYADLPRKDGSTLHTYHRVFVGKILTGELQGSDETIPTWMRIDDVLAMNSSQFLINTQDMILRAKELLYK